MNRIILSETEIKALKALGKSLSSRFSSVEDPAFLKDACIHAHEVPRRLRVFLNDFKLLEPAPGVCLVSGYPIDDERIGRTPEHWKMRSTPSPALEEEILLVLLGALLGDA